MAKQIEDEILDYIEKADEGALQFMQRAVSRKLQVLQQDREPQDVPPVRQRRTRKQNKHDWERALSPRKEEVREPEPVI
jgi:hypothetical protein